jgi:hypothetical protein
LRPQFHKKEVFLACRTLFGAEVQLSLDFLEYLQTSGAKAAFRERAKQNHPDLFASQALHIQHRQSEIFREVVAAFDLVNAFLKHRDEFHGRSSARPGYYSSSRQYSSPPHTAKRPKPATGHYYRGVIPQRRLEFGSYLYYRGMVTYQSLIEALVWQRRQRPPIGDIARRWNWLSDADIVSISRDRNAFGRFGEKAVRLGLLRHSQVQTLLYFQRARQQKIGQYFIQASLILPEQIERLVKDLFSHNAKVSTATADHGSRQTATG